MSETVQIIIAIIAYAGIGLGITVHYGDESITNGTSTVEGVIFTSAIWPIVIVGALVAAVLTCAKDRHPKGRDAKAARGAKRVEPDGGAGAP